MIPIFINFCEDDIEVSLANRSGVLFQTLGYYQNYEFLNIAGKKFISIVLKFQEEIFIGVTLFYFYNYLYI